jgi:ESCRT-II complex subunit VPS36
MCEARLETETSDLELIKLSFRGGGITDFTKVLQQALSDRKWEVCFHVLVGRLNSKYFQDLTLPSAPSSQPKKIGVSGIMERIEESNKQTDSNLSTAFEDLESLMAKAAEMVKLAENIGSKIATEQEPGMTKEILAFRSNLMDLGIQDPVTK